MSDLISREYAIRQIQEAIFENNGNFETDAEHIIEFLKILPDIQIETEEKEELNRLRKRVKNQKEQLKTMDYLRKRVTAQAELIKDLQIKERGKWVYDANESKHSIEKLYMCSACRSYHAWGLDEVELFNFCPNCGAIMDELTETE